MEVRQQVCRLHESKEAHPRVLLRFEPVGEARAFDELANEVHPPRRRQAPEVKYARNAEALDAGQRRGLADERHDLGLLRTFAEQLQRNAPIRDAIAGRPNFATPTLAQSFEWLVSSREFRASSGHVGSQDWLQFRAARGYNKPPR